jgi:hypothetical protein
MIRFIVLAAATALAAAAPVRAAEDTGAASDFRCMVAAIALYQSTNPQVKDAGMMASLYYLGRLDGRTPNVDLEAGLKQQFERMSAQELQAEAVRCGGALQARGKAVTEIGARLKAATAPKVP